MEKDCAVLARFGSHCQPTGRTIPIMFTLIAYSCSARSPHLALVLLLWHLAVKYSENGAAEAAHHRLAIAVQKIEYPGIGQNTLIEWRREAL